MTTFPTDLDIFFRSGSSTQPLEIVTTRQWYVRNGAYDEDLRLALSVSLLLFATFQP